MVEEVAVAEGKLELPLRGGHAEFPSKYEVRGRAIVSITFVRDSSHYMKKRNENARLDVQKMMFIDQPPSDLVPNQDREEIASLISRMLSM